MFSVQGFCRGVKSVPNFDKTKPPKIVAGIASPKVGGFQGEEEIHELVLSPEQVSQGFDRKFNEMKDQPIACRFEISNGAMNGKSWIKLLCAGEPKLLASPAAKDSATQNPKG